MPHSVLAHAFAHHVWASLRILDACDGLTDEQLGTPVPGTYGSILDTLRHLVGSDCGYLAVTAREPDALIYADAMAVPELRTAMERNGQMWMRFLEANPDPDEVLIRRRDDGSETRAPIGIRLAQAIHHGTDHRSQICTVLTTLGIEPPMIDVWDYGWTNGFTAEIAPNDAEGSTA
jgi:uncharacterized damage-inducible protein DinB